MKTINFELNVGMMLRRRAKSHPHKTAVVFGEERLSYRQFNERVNKCANAMLQLGLTKGDKIATLLNNSLELLELYWAASKIGTVIVPLNPMLHWKDALRMLNDCEAKVIVFEAQYEMDIENMQPDLKHIIDGGYIVVGDEVFGKFTSYKNLTEKASDLEPECMINEYDPYSIMYSSGTTGLPKGIVHTHRTKIMYAFLWGIEYGVNFNSVVLCAGSLVFNGSLAFMFPAICAGATYVLVRKFNAKEVAEIIQKEKVTHTALVPTQIIQLLDLPDFSTFNLSSLKVLLTLGAPLPLERKKQISHVLPGILYELYGLTEGFLTTLRPEDMMANKLGSVGSPMIFNEFKIVDDNMNELQPGEIGEIIGRGPTLMAEYYNNREATENAIHDERWLKTGDLGWKDEDDFIYLVDRKKDMIISGGVNVYPRDIEEVIAAHPAVSECAVFGIPHPLWGEVPYAHVILKQGQNVSEDELKNWVNERVSAKYQRLHGIKIVDEFPRNASGKILKRVMRESYFQQNE